MCLLGVLLVLAQPAGAIVVSDDPDLHIVTPPSALDMVGYINVAYGRTAVLIDPWFILTAKHNVEYKPLEGKSFAIHLEDGTHYYYLAEAWLHPTADLAVVRLTSSTELGGYPLYEGTGEVSEEAILAGFGESGTGDTVEAGGDPNYPRGTNRYGYNRIDSIYTDGDGVQHLKTDFDSPSSHGPGSTLGADREVMISAGDSGGPAFIEVDEVLYIAGIHSSVAYADPDHWPTWGDVGYHVRVGTYADWIMGVIPDQPPTATGDFNMDGATDDLDIDAMHAAMRAGGTDLWYDICPDGVVNRQDVDILVCTILATAYGDANLDRTVDGSDYTAWADHYGLTGVGWRNGEFNGDDIVDGADYTAWADHYDDDGAGATGLVYLPEPAALLLLALAAPVLLRRRSQIRRGGRR